MSTIGWIIVIIVAVIVIAALIAGVMAARRRRLKQRAAQAAELRSAAMGQRPDIGTARREATESDANARLARAEADRAEEEAERSRRALAQEEAAHEDRLREADRLDPEVDHRSEDYEPGADIPGGTTAPAQPRAARPGAEPTQATDPLDTPGQGAHRRE